MKLLSYVFVLILSLGLVVTCNAQNAKAVQQRMQERLSAIDSLKQKESVGEDNKGFLQARGAIDAAGSAIVSAENKDRAEVYAELARRTGGSAETVGAVRARRIAESSAKGIWLQDESGRWYKK